MAVTKPVSPPKKNIGSVDITGFSGGWYANGEQNAKGNMLVEGSNVALTIDGFLTERYSLQPWLPDTQGTVYKILPVLWQGVVLNFTADNGKMRWCIEGDPLGWQDCGGANTITTGLGIKAMLLRVADVILVMNGNDKLFYVDIATKSVVKYAFVSDPVTQPTAAPSGTLANSGSYKIYYGYTFSSPTGETKISPILSYTINKTRDQWKDDGTDFLTISRPVGNPSGARFWNLYIAEAASGGTIQPNDMLRLATGLDLNTVSLMDDGTLAVDLGRGNPPAQNSTDGPRCKYGIETNGRPILYGDVDAPYNIWIGGDGDFALDFSSSNGGYRAEVSKGTNFYPASVFGFRNGQGVPSLTILFTNTEGISKQATLEQQTINYGNQSFVVWGVTEQNYGAAGVASAYGVVNYKGEATFPTTDGFQTMSTQPQLQNVIATKSIDKDIKEYTKRIKTSALAEIVGTGWNDQLLYLIPAYGFDTPNQILIRDMNNNGSWIPPFEIPAQWIGTVTPPKSPGFVYLCQGNKIYKLFESFGTVDYKNGSSETFATYAKGALLGINEAHNAHQAVVQAAFYIVDLIGERTIGVNYRNQFGKMKTKKKKINGPAYVLSSSGGWGDPMYTYGQFPMLAGGWDAVAAIDAAASALKAVTKWHFVPVGDLASELQWWYETPKGYNSGMTRAISFEGENLGVKPHLR
jgi:hypothetical protein